MFGDAYLAIVQFMEQGGDVLWLIAGLTFLMWTLIFERVWYFQSEHKLVVSEATGQWEARPVAPLLGLLGTVIGMILTFQAITLFGTGDPKTMAGGISTALMTTVLGLCVAIPMTLLHSIVATRSRSVIHVLEEQTAGLIADHAEKSGQALG